ELRSAWSSWVLRRPWSNLPIIELIRQYRVATHQANVFSFSCQGVSRGSRTSPRTAAALTVHPETCMRDVVINAECSVTGTMVKFLAVEPKEALRWGTRHSS